MSLISRGFSAVGKLVALGVLVVVFFGGMVLVILRSLQGAEIKVPEITGKNFGDSERELTQLGLKIKKRADRVTKDPPNTVIEQMPRPGETVKTGQMILVVTSKSGGEGDEPAPVLKKTDEDDTSKIEDMISDKPKKAKANSNSNKKKVDTTRDVIGNESNSNSNSNSSDSNSNKKDPGDHTVPAANKPVVKPPAGNTSHSTDGRPRVSNRP